MGRTQEELDTILEGIDVPHKRGYIATLGGVDRASIMLTLCFDRRETWANGILENSSYIKLHYKSDGVLEMIVQSHLSKRFRKCKVPNVGEALRKINKFISSLELEK